MPAATASRTRASAKHARASLDAPPAKKTRLSQPTSAHHKDGLAALVNGTSSKKPVASVKVNGVKNARKEKVDDAQAVVAAGPAGHGDVDMEDAPQDVVDISSAEEQNGDSSEDDSEVEEDAQAHGRDASPAPKVNGNGTQDTLPEDGTAEPEEMSFGERLQAQEPESRAPQVVDVEAAMEIADSAENALTTTFTSKTLSAPSVSSLGTVLTQALRTNDRDLLDSCLRVSKVDAIQATVERLPSPLVGNLLQKLAERLYRKPGRAGMLMIWVQWSLAAHGGYLASQPQLVKQLASLNQVLKERANGLQPLLSLKGRLDMLQVQLELRRRYQKQTAVEEENQAVIYVEGEDDVSSGDEDDQSVTGAARRKDRDDSEDESSSDEMPTTMEVDEDSEEGSEDSEDLIDDEAEETDDDEGDDMSEPMSDDDEIEGIDDDSSEDDSGPAKRSLTGRARY